MNNYNKIKNLDINRNMLIDAEHKLIEAQHKHDTNTHTALEIKNALEHIRTAKEHQHRQIMLEIAKQKVEVNAY